MTYVCCALTPNRKEWLHMKKKFSPWPCVLLPSRWCFCCFLWSTFQVKTIICYRFMYNFRTSHRFTCTDSKNSLVLNLNSAFDSKLFFHGGTISQGWKALLNNYTSCLNVLQSLWWAVRGKDDGWDTILLVLLRLFSLLRLKERAVSTVWGSHVRK